MMLRQVYANPEKELARMRDQGLLVQLARGVFLVKPDDIPVEQAWAPPLEESAMAYAVAAFGPDQPALYGVGAARWWHAIPRAIGVTVIAAPRTHRPVELLTGGRIVFTVRRATGLDTQPANTSIGIARVTTTEQTLIDLIAHPDLGSMPNQAAEAARQIVTQANRGQLERLLERQPAAVARRVRALLKEAM